MKRASSAAPIRNDLTIPIDFYGSVMGGIAQHTIQISRKLKKGLGIFKWISTLCFVNSQIFREIHFLKLILTFPIPTVCPSVASRNLLLYQSLPTSIPYRHAIVRRRKDDTGVGTAARGIVA